MVWLLMESLISKSALIVDHPLDVGAIDSDPNEVLEAGGDDEDDEDDQEEVGINEEADNGENCKLSTSFSRKKHSFNSIFMPQGSSKSWLPTPASGSVQL